MCTYADPNDFSLGEEAGTGCGSPIFIKTHALLDPDQVAEALAAKGETDAETTGLSYSVPTGNFGDVLAGYYAKRMGLPVDKLVVATNENDILHR